VPGPAAWASASGGGGGGRRGGRCLGLGGLGSALAVGRTPVDGFLLGGGSRGRGIRIVDAVGGTLRRVLHGIAEGDDLDLEGLAARRLAADVQEQGKKGDVDQQGQQEGRGPMPGPVGLAGRRQDRDGGIGGDGARRVEYTLDLVSGAAFAGHLVLHAARSSNGDGRRRRS